MLHIHLISLNSVHTLLNDPFANLSFVFHMFEFLMFPGNLSDKGSFYSATCYYFLTSSFLNLQLGHSGSLIFPFTHIIKILPELRRIHKKGQTPSQPSLASPTPHSRILSIRDPAQLHSPPPTLLLTPLPTPRHAFLALVQLVSQWLVMCCWTMSWTPWPSMSSSIQWG